jgi:hypothetical protein
MQIYCTVQELIEDLEKPGDVEEKVLRYIRSASRYLSGKFGKFLPEIATRALRGEGMETLYVGEPLLRITSISHNGTALTTGVDFSLEPQERWWGNGPYSRLVSDPDSSNLGTWLDIAGAVSLAGWFGLYDESRLLTTIAGQLVGDSTIVVANGSILSPGMLLTIESEFEEVTGLGTATTTTATLNGAIDNMQEEITLSNGALVNIGESIKVNFERMLVLDIEGNDVQVARGYARTKKASHLTGQTVYAHRTYTVARGANGSTAAAHGAVSVYRQAVPDDINYLCRQIAGLEWKKAQTGFSGKQGTADGETFYYNEFPSLINKVEELYRFGV